MRRFLVYGLSCLALAIAARCPAQEMIISPGAEGVRPVSGLFQGSCGHGDCCPSTCKTCIAVPDVKKVPHTVYGVKCIDYCLPKCPHFSLHLFRHGCDSSCGSGHCGHDGCGHFTCPPSRSPCPDCASCGKVRTKRVLLKRIETCDEPTFKCEVVEKPCAPVCVPHCAPACVPGAVIPGEKIGPPTKKTPGAVYETAPGASLRAPTTIPVPATLAAPAVSPALPPATRSPLPAAGPVTTIPTP